MAGEADQAQGQPGSEKWVTWRGTYLRLEKWLREKAFWLRAWRDREQRAAHVAGGGVQWDVLGEPLLERDVPAARGVREGEEQEAFVGVVAAREELVALGEADVGVRRRRLHGEAARVPAHHALLLGGRERSEGVEDFDV